MRTVFKGSAHAYKVGSRTRRFFSSFVVRLGLVRLGAYNNQNKNTVLPCTILLHCLLSIIYFISVLYYFAVYNIMQALEDLQSVKSTPKFQLHNGAPQNH
jgi:hypothetical protein